MSLTIEGFVGGEGKQEKTVTAGTSVVVVTPDSGNLLNKVTVNPTPSEAKTVTAGTGSTTVSPSAGKLLSNVTVNPTPSEAKTVAAGTGNITVTPSAGKLLSGVTVQPTPSQEKTATAGTAATTVTPDSGYLLSSVTVNPTPSQTKTVTAKDVSQTVRPSSGKLLSKVTVKPIVANAFNFTVVDSNSSVQINNALTVKDMIWDGTRFIAVAANSDGDVYFIHSTSLTGSWTVLCAVNKSAAIIPSGIAHFPAIDRYVITCRSGSYSDYNIMYTPLNASATERWTNAAYDMQDVVFKDGYYWAVGGTTSGGSVSYYTNVQNTNSALAVVHGSFPYPMIKCCMYGTYPVAIASNGHYTYKNSIADSVVAGDLTIEADLTTYCIETMGDYLVVAGTKSDGTYIYCTNGVPGSMKWKKRKISNSVYTPVALAYASGMCVLAYKNGSNICFASATTPEGIWLTTAALGTGLSGYTTGGLASNGTSVGHMAYNGSNCKASQITSDLTGTGSGYGG